MVQVEQLACADQCDRWLPQRSAMRTSKRMFSSVKSSSIVAPNTFNMVATRKSGRALTAVMP